MALLVHKAVAVRVPDAQRTQADVVGSAREMNALLLGQTVCDSLQQLANVRSTYPAHQRGCFSEYLGPPAVLL